jgi:hypothetical protein
MLPGAPISHAGDPDVADLVATGGIDQLGDDVVDRLGLDRIATA